MIPVAQRRATEALERGRHLCGLAVVDEATAAVEEGIPRAVTSATRRPTIAAAYRVDNHITLDAVAVDGEPVGALLVRQRVEDQRDPVVAAGAVAVHTVGASDRRVRVVGIESKIEVLAAVGDPDLGRLSGGHTVER